MQLGNWFALIFALLLSSCSTVKVFDDPWCVDAGKFGAECFYVVSNNEFSLDKYQWDRLRIGQTCSATSEPSLGWINLRTALEKLCADSNKCSPEQKAILKDAVKGAGAIQKKAFKAFERVRAKLR